MKHLASLTLEFAKKVAATYPKWWDRLTYDEQKEYIHDHPGTDLRTTAQRPVQMTGQEPITAKIYTIKSRLVDKATGKPVGGVQHEIINTDSKLFEGAKTLQDLVDKYEGDFSNATKSLKVTNIKPRKPSSERPAEGPTDAAGLHVPVTSDKPLVVGNMEQKILLLTEMMGQMSDGAWENTRGWEDYRHIDWDTVGVGDNIGRKFYARKTNYNFTNSELLDIVGDRMLTTMNLYKKYPKIILPILEKDRWLLPESYGEALRLFNEPQKDEYWIKKRQKLIDAGVTLDMYRDINEHPVYSKSDMVRDLQGLKKSFRAQSSN
jgi:hypothetical protein